DLGEVVGPAALNFFQFCRQAAPFRSLEQRQDVAAVAVDVHQVGVEPADGELPWFAAHVSQYGCAQPRLTSSALRSSIAVSVVSRYAVSSSLVFLMSRSSALLGSVCGSSCSMPAYLSRTARSCARVPAGMMVLALPLSCSKSTSQIQETSVPSALRSLRPMMKFLPCASSVAVLTVSLKPAGFLLRTRMRWRPRNSMRSWRPNAAVKVVSRS